MESEESDDFLTAAGCRRGREADHEGLDDDDKSEESDDFLTVAGCRRGREADHEGLLPAHELDELLDQVVQGHEDDEDGGDKSSDEGGAVADAALVAEDVGCGRGVVVFAEAAEAPEFGTSALQEVLQGTRPADRSRAQKVVLAAHMREQRSIYRRRVERANWNRERAQLYAIMESACLRCNGLQRTWKRGQLVLYVDEDGKHRRLTNNAWCRMTFEFHECSMRTCAMIFKCAISIVESTNKLCCFILLQTQRTLLRGLVQPSPSEPIISAVMGIAFDEAGKVLALPTSELLPQKRKGKFQIFVTLSDLIVEYGFGSRCLRLVCPPVVMTGTSYDFVATALVHSGMLQEVLWNALAVLNSAGINILHWTRDGAASNDKALALVNKIICDTYPEMLITDKQYSFHMNGHIQGALLSEVLDVVKGLYSLSAMNKWGINFMRVVGSVPIVAVRNITVLRLPPPAENKAFSEELLDYATLHYETRAAEGDVHISKAQYRSHGEGLFQILNGQFWAGGCWAHHCVSSDCCNGWDRKVTLKKLIKHLVGFALSSAPTSPEIAKWTKVGPSIDRVFIGFCIHNCLSELYNTVFRRSSLGLACRMLCPRMAKTLPTYRTLLGRAMHARPRRRHASTSAIGRICSGWRLGLSAWSLSGCYCASFSHAARRIPHEVHTTCRYIDGCDDIQGHSHRIDIV